MNSEPKSTINPTSRDLTLTRHLKTSPGAGLCGLGPLSELLRQWFTPSRL
ncbi:MAG: hypothetical protein U1G08_08830 [Verrucomicrobiota bacterium]